MSLKCRQAIETNALLSLWMSTRILDRLIFATKRHTDHKKRKRLLCSLRSFVANECVWWLHYCGSVKRLSSIVSLPPKNREQPSFESKSKPQIASKKRLTKMILKCPPSDWDKRLTLFLNEYPYPPLLYLCHEKPQRPQKTKSAFVVFVLFCG